MSKTPRSQANVKQTLCPCGKLRNYAACCGIFHAGQVAPDAETLMRSRYTAYVLNDEAYLLASWHASTRPASLDLSSEAGAQSALQWLGLEVKQFIPAGDAATVEFIARYRCNGRAVRLHEVSRFLREDGRWFYVDGNID
jgi:SEC-C motif-containing protein